MEKDFTITDSTKIAWILQSLCEGRQLVSVDLGGPPHGAPSIIVSVKDHCGVFTLDRFATEQCHRRVLEGERFTLRSSLNGLDVSAGDLQVRRLDRDSDGDFYEVPLPERMVYLQRRETFRARIVGVASVPVRFRKIGGDIEIDGAELIDISSEGCCVALPGAADSEDGLPGTGLVLQLALPEQPVLTVEVKCRHRRHLPRSRVWYVGCAFCTPATPVQMTIDRFVSHIQRLQRQREALFD